jgi:hypothetical protein
MESWGSKCRTERAYKYLFHTESGYVEFKIKISDYLLHQIGDWVRFVQLDKNKDIDQYLEIRRGESEGESFSSHFNLSNMTVDPNNKYIAKDERLRPKKDDSDARRVRGSRRHTPTSQNQSGMWEDETNARLKNKTKQKTRS